MALVYSKTLPFYPPLTSGVSQLNHNMEEKRNFLLICTTFDIVAAQTYIPCQSCQQVNVEMYMGEEEEGTHK